MIAVLFYGLNHFSLLGMIIAAISAFILEILIAECILIYKLEARWKDIFLLTNVLKTGIVSLIAGAATYAVYTATRNQISIIGENAVIWIFEPTRNLLLSLIGEGALVNVFQEPKIGIVDFVSGVLILGVSFTVFLSIYMMASYFGGVIDDDDQETVKRFFSRVLRIVKPVTRAE